MPRAKASSSEMPHEEQIPIQVVAVSPCLLPDEVKKLLRHTIGELKLLFAARMKASICRSFVPRCPGFFTNREESCRAEASGSVSSTVELSSSWGTDSSFGSFFWPGKDTFPSFASACFQSS